MAQYHYRENVHRRAKSHRRAKIALLIPLVVIVVLGVGLGVYMWQQAGVNDTPKRSQPINASGGISTPMQSYRNEQFYFESTREWQLTREASRLPHYYVFNTQRGGLVEYELIITIDSPLPAEPVNYLASVAVKNGRLELQKISPRCSSKLPQRPETEVQEFEGVKFTCAALSSREVIAAGVPGSSYNLPLVNSKGQIKTVNIFFRNHTAASQPDAFSQIISSFRLN